MNYFLRLVRTRHDYAAACRELAWRSYAHLRGWLDYENSLPWHWVASRWLYHKYYKFVHRKDEPLFLLPAPCSIIRYYDGKVMWSYSRELREDEPRDHAKTIDLFTLEKKWEKKAVLVGWIGSRVAPSTWPSHLKYEDYVVPNEEGKLNSRPTDLPGWEHIEYSKMILIRKGK
jgi:hypothetical protein